MKNVAVSVRARLLNLSRESKEPLNALMEQYVTGRFLYRLANSSHRERFVVKGAQLFRIWGAEQHRPTRDLDLLGFGDSSQEAIEAIFTELVAAPVTPPDGIEWGEIKTGTIRDDISYGGVRATVSAQLAGARLSLQIDVGFGDAITPSATEAVWHELLDLPSARLLIYPAETVIAEKLEAAVSLGFDNSRMKDFFDLYWLSENQTFNDELLIRAIQATFSRRETVIPSDTPDALSEHFANDPKKNLQWNAFRKKGHLNAPDLDVVIARLSTFLLPILSEKSLHKTWYPKTGWTSENHS